MAATPCLSVRPAPLAGAKICSRSDRSSPWRKSQHWDPPKSETVTSIQYGSSSARTTYWRGDAAKIFLQGSKYRGHRSKVQCCNILPGFQRVCEISLMPKFAHYQNLLLCQNYALPKSASKALKVGMAQQEQSMRSFEVVESLMYRFFRSKNYASISRRNRCYYCVACCLPTVHLGHMEFVPSKKDSASNGNR